MPIYEFKCRSCSHEFEQLIRSSHWDAEVQCPQCDASGEEKFEKLLSVAGAVGVGASRDSGSACSGNPGSCGRCGNF